MMAVKNSYPNLPEIKYSPTKIGMSYVVAHARTLIGLYGLVPVQVALAIFINESANGNKGVNNGYCGTQADVGRWDVDWSKLSGKPIGTSVKVDNSGAARRFLCFDTDCGYKASLELATIKAKQKGIVDGVTYYAKWVNNGTPDPNDVKDFDRLLNGIKANFS